MALQFHAAANAFPMMGENRFRELVADIAANGQHQPIILCDGAILDGRNRYNACLELRIKPKTVSYVGDPWAYVWSLNAQRRDLVAEQRYLIWKFCTEHSEEWQDAQRAIQEEANRKRSEAAKVQHAVSAPRHGETMDRPQLVDEPKSAPRGQGSAAKAAASKVNRGAVERGDKLSSERPDLAEKVRMGELKPAAAYRQMKKDAVAGKVASLPTGKYRVLYADPPWSYSDKQSVKGDFGTGTGAAEAHYPSLSVSELRALPISGLVQEDAVLFLWVTSPLLPEGLNVAQAWGFKYKAAFVWDKVKHNMGHYNSVRHELLLICTRGSCTPDVSTLFDSVQSIERTTHSEKPEEFRTIIDTLYPHGERLELFRRGNTPDGWKVWGNETHN